MAAKNNKSKIDPKLKNYIVDKNGKIVFSNKKDKDKEVNFPLILDCLKH
jgi:hypothetical protein